MLAISSGLRTNLNNLVSNMSINPLPLLVAVKTLIFCEIKKLHSTVLK